MRLCPYKDTLIVEESVAVVSTVSAIADDVSHCSGLQPALHAASALIAALYPHAMSVARREPAGRAFANVWADKTFPAIRDDYAALLQMMPTRLEQRQKEKRDKEREKAERKNETEQREEERGIRR